MRTQRVVKPPDTRSHGAGFKSRGVADLITILGTMDLHHNQIANGIGAIEACESTSGGIPESVLELRAALMAIGVDPIRK